MKLKLLLLSFCTTLVTYGQATLPVSRTTWNSGAPVGWTDWGTASYTSSFACSTSNAGKLDGSNDYYEVFFSGVPDQLNFELKGASFSGGTFSVQESPDGVSWNDLNVYTSMAGSCSSENYTLNSTTRYVRFYYVNKSSGNVSIDDVEITAGVSVNPEINITGNGNAIIDGDTTPSFTDDTNFGSTTVGVDVSHVFTIENTGTDPLSISGITITGVDAADYYISIPPSSTVAVGGTTTFEVTFSPSVAGTNNATINVANNDGDENPYTFDIVGSATTCTPTTSVSSITPTSGPIGTIVTLNGSGFTTATDVKFGIYSATFTIVSNTVIQATVPLNATSSNIIIQDAGGCDLLYSSFTVITKDNSTCDPTAIGITDLFISEVTDASSGSLSYIQIFNATGATVDMTDYEVRIRNNGNPTGDDIPLTGTLVNGGTFVLATSVGSGCSVPGGDGTYADQNDVSSGVNNNDCIHLAKLGTVIDTWGICDGSAWIGVLGLGTKGYDFKRKPTATPLPSTTFVDTDWTIVDFDSCSDNYDLINAYEGIKTSPSVSSLGTTYGAGCSSATIGVTGTEAVLGGAPLTYQWYYSAPGDTGWTMVSNGGVYSGATSDNLNISDITGLSDYQYYCQVMEDTATCFIASDAVSISGGATTTWNGSTWSNSAPNTGVLAILDGDYDTSINGSFSCCSLVVNSSQILDIQANDYVEIQYNLTVNGTLNVWNDGSLIQVDDSGINTGDINYERTTTGNILDYVYWSSPVDGVNTPSNGYVFSWDADYSNPNGGWGYWLFATNTTMAPGVGYIMRDVFTNTFTGVARNGVIQPSIKRANFTGADFSGTNGITITNKDDNWNLVGNPYPSAIRALDFLTINTNIEGAVRIWTHGTSPSNSNADPVYDDFVYNYSVNDYIVYNGTGTLSGPAGFNGLIAGGQGFMINMDDGSATTQTITFNNSMRDKNYDNGQFYRQSNPLNRVSNEIEKNRIWLDLADSNNISTRTLIGYVSNATYQKDRLYDAVVNAQSNSLAIYSIINNERMSIQGRALPFDETDKVQLGINVPEAGLYSIGLSAIDGLFETGQDVFIEDKELNIVFDIKETPYSFYSGVGEFKDRFILRYTSSNFANDDFMSEEDVVVSNVENELLILSEKEPIKTVVIHNYLGQLLYNKDVVNNEEHRVSTLELNNQPIIITIVLKNNNQITKKLFFNN